MPWTYHQETGELYAPDGVFEGKGYSGHGFGLDNPEAEKMHDVGPIPRGEYHIGLPQNPVGHLGPLAMPLLPTANTNDFGRSAFFMHGDNSAMNESASNGCIVVGRAIREMVAISADRTLIVV